MVSINYSAREVCCKIVYYGPGLSGKTTNLQYIHSKVPQDTRGKLISLATEADRTLYFDFLPINIGTINDFQAKFQLYTVPGQVYYNATRKLVLRGVDGLVFVADSQPDKMDENIESLANLEENLKEYGYDVDQMPLVIQYNKADLPGVLTADELNAKLNTKGRPFFMASATVGTGVFDTLKLVIKLVLDKAKSTSTATSATKAQAADPPPPPAPEPTPYPSSERVPVAPTPTPPAGVEASREPVQATSASIEAPADTGPAVPAAVTAVAEPAAPVGYRPYPGSMAAQSGNQAVRAERQAGPVGLGHQSGELPADALGKNIGTDSIDKTPGGSPAISSVQMAPSLRRRGGTKKRGFFKRLFGIK